MSARPLEVQLRLSLKCFCGAGFLLSDEETLEAARDHVMEHLLPEKAEDLKSPPRPPASTEV